MKTIKTLSLIIFLFSCSLAVKAQGGHIDSIKMVPSFPTTEDSTNFHVYITFPSGYCFTVYHTSYINGSIISNLSQYCYGTYLFLCEPIDTIKIPKLNYGEYVFQYSLESNEAYTGCTNFYPADSIDFPFTISNPFGIQNHLYPRNQFHLSTNSECDLINIRFNEPPNNANVIIYNLLGQVLYKETIFNIDTRISLNLPSGLYLVNVSIEGNSQTEKMIIKNNH